MPAAAVIPALKMHRTIAAVKKLVVESMPKAWSTYWVRTKFFGFSSVFLSSPLLVAASG